MVSGTIALLYFDMILLDRSRAAAPKGTISRKTHMGSFRSVGEQRLEAGSWRPEAGGWRLEAGGRRPEAGDWRSEAGRRGGDIQMYVCTYGKLPICVLQDIVPLWAAAQNEKRE